MVSNTEIAIQTQKLIKRFGEKTAVNGIDINIRKGEIFSLLGPNGAGKTTTIKMLCGLLKPTAGTATILGHDIVKDALKVKKNLNISPQETAVATRLNVWENLMLMGGVYGLRKKESRNRAEELIELLDLKEDLKPQARHLSGGMQRRLSIAMALISDPQVLFLDEPTLGLDPKARRNLWSCIENLKGKKTILLTTHYLEEADALADRISIIRNGDIIATGTSAELKNNLIGMQTMLIRANQLNPAILDELKTDYPDSTLNENELQIKAKQLDFEKIVGYLHSKKVNISWLTMKEPTLDDVFLKLTEEEDVQ